MEKIIRPKDAGQYPDREIDCDKAMDAILRDVLDAANNAGWSTPEAMEAIARVLPKQRSAYEADPDPAEDGAPHQ